MLSDKFPISTVEKWYFNFAIPALVPLRLPNQLSRLLLSFRRTALLSLWLLVYVCVCVWLCECFTCLLACCRVVAVCFIFHFVWHVPNLFWTLNELKLKKFCAPLFPRCHIFKLFHFLQTQFGAEIWFSEIHWFIAQISLLLVMAFTYTKSFSEWVAQKTLRIVKELHLEQFLSYWLKI